MPLIQLLPQTDGLSPEQIKAAEEQRRVDIIAVHGLNPFGKKEEDHAFNTWTKPSGPKGNLWLRDNLKELAPAVRVFLYQYNSRLVWGGNKANFSDKADEILEDILGERKKTPERPIIFVGHSLGGLLIEQALINAYNSKRYEGIKAAIAGLVFFGTPHGGGNRSLVSIGSAAAKVARSVGAQKNRDIEQILQSGSLFTDIHQRLFKNQKLDHPIISFWEGYGEIVPKNSAIFGLPDDKEVVVEIKADHGDICCFDMTDAKDRENFKRVWRALEDMYELAIRQGGQGTQESQAPSLIVRSIQTLLSEANAVRNPAPDPDENLAWFTNTTLYYAWLSPARGNPPICSRFLRYSGPRQDTFSTSYIKCARHLEIDIIYLDCSHALFHLTDPLPTVGTILNLTPVGLAMWSLIGQALYDRRSSSLESAISACWEAHPEVSEAVENGGPISFNLLGELLKTALNFRPDRDVIIVLDHVDAMTQDELVLLRNAVQKVLDDQRLQDVAQTRAIVVGKRESKVSFAFKGTADIDENTEYRECLQALSFEKIGLRRSRITSAGTNTNNWLWTYPAYTNWRRQSSSILWIVGKPGSGKSVLSRSIQERFLRDLSESSYSSNNVPSGKPIVCAWFYSEREGLSSHLLMLRAVVYQIVDQERDYFHYLTDVYREVDPFAALEGSFWSIAGLLHVLERIILDPDRVRPIFCVLDGLDESKVEARNSRDSLLDILEVLCSLCRNSKGFRAILLSRDHPDIDHKLKSFERIVMQEVNEPDVVTVVEHGISSLLNMLRSDESSDEEAAAMQPQSLQMGEKRALEEIRKYVLNQAGGVILWVKTCFSALETRALEPFASLEDLVSELHILPPEMVELYERVIIKQKKSLKSPSSRALAYRAILWVRIASESRRLRTQELLDALSIPDDVDSALQSENDPFRVVIRAHSAGSLRRHLQRLCGPFVECIQPQAVSSQTNPVIRRNNREEQVQLVHQTAKEFLEASPQADFLRIPPNAHKLIEDESLAYIRISFPANHAQYDPIPRPFNDLAETGVTAILEYLERKPLLSFVCNSFPDLKASIPERYRLIFQNAVNPPEEDRSRLQVIAEEYFYIACSNGWATALENLIILQTLSLQDRSSTAEWYLFENSAIQGALRNSIRHGLLPEIKILAWYVAERGLDLLDFPREGRDDAQGNNRLSVEALETGNEDIAMAVIGYDDENQKGRFNVAADISRVRDAVWTVIQFWGTPPKTLPKHTGAGASSLANSGANLYGMNVQSFGANIYGANLYGANVMAADVIDAIYPLESYLPDARERRQSRQSHRELSTEVPVLRGGLNLTNPRLPSIQEGLRDMEDLMQQRVLADSEESAYLRAQRELFGAEMRAQNRMQTQTTEEQFLLRMNDAAWKTASSAASDKIQ